MELVNNYLSELGKYLPSDQRDDIVSELREDISEQVAAHAREQGRAPEASDEHLVLQDLGHPLKVASAYKSRHYLIGPALYPAYVQTMRTTLLIVLALVVLLGVAAGAGETGAFSLKGLASQAFEIGLWAAGIVTVVFVTLEADEEKLDWYHNWNPDSLPASSSPLVMSDLVTNLVTEAVFLLWWNSLLNFDFGLDSDRLDLINFAPVWQDLFWPLNLLFGAFLLLHVYVLIRGSWQRLTAGIELVLCVLLLVTIAALLGSGVLVVEAGSERLVWADYTLKITLVVIGGFTIWDGILAYSRVR